MNIHIIRSSEFDPYQFTAIVNLIRQYPGPVQYLVHEKPAEFSEEETEEEIWEEERLGKMVMPMMEEPLNFMRIKPMVRFVSWDSIFNQCEKSRRKYRIPEDEPVVLLTELANEYNWFSGADPNGKLNLFIHTDMWERFISEDFRYPVAYELASIPLQQLMFGSFRELVNYAHQVPRGCMNDLCKDKSQIGLKLRTGDICPECRQRIRDRNADPQVVGQVFRIFEGIRSQMLFRASFDQNATPSRMVIDYPGRRISLTDLGNLEIPLNPMERTVYHFFMKHPEGIAFTSLPDYRNELYTLYRHYSAAGSIATITARIDDLCANKGDGLSQVISRIRRKFEEKVPDEMAKAYVIGGVSGRKRKISLDRELVSILD